MPKSAARVAAASAGLVALAVLCVVFVRQGSGRVDLDERTALRLAEGRGVNQEVAEKIAYGGTHAELALPGEHVPQLLAANAAREDLAKAEAAGNFQKLEERRLRRGALAQAHADTDAAGIGWLARVKPLSPRAADAQTSAMAMANAFFRNSPGDFGHASLSVAEMPKEGAKDGAPVWPGYADFKRHEEALRGITPTKQSLNVPRTDTPQCPCRGGCPCPAHGHGGNIVERVEESKARVLKRGIEEGLALGLRIGVKVGRDEELLTQESTAHQKVQPVKILSPKSEERWVNKVESRWSPDTARNPRASSRGASVRDVERASPVQESDEMAKVQSDLKMAATGGHAWQASQPASSGNLPWPFKPALPTPYPAPKGGEFRGHEKKSAEQSQPPTRMMSSDERLPDRLDAARDAIDIESSKRAAWGWDKKKEAYRKLLAKANAADQASRGHAADVGAGDERLQDRAGGWHSKVPVTQHAPAAADASARANSAAVLHATRDFDRRAGALKTQIEETPSSPLPRNPALARAIAAVHDGHFQIPRTSKEKATDETWQERVARADREMQQARSALAHSSRETAAVSALSANANAAAAQASAKKLPVKAAASKSPGFPDVEAQVKELKKEVVKDENVAAHTHELVKQHKLAAPTSTQELADFEVPPNTRLGEDGAKALGFDGLKGLELHLARIHGNGDEDRQEVSRARADQVTAHVEGHEAVAAMSTADSGEPGAPQGASSGGSSVRVEVRALGEGRGANFNTVGMKGKVEAEDAAMRSAVRRAAIKKAEAIGPLAAVALGYTGVEQLAAHLEREALDLE